MLASSLAALLNVVHPPQSSFSAIMRLAFSTATRVAARTLALSPNFVTSYPKASDISSPPCLLRLLPAGAVAGWDSHPLEKRRLVTAHTLNGSSDCPAAGADAVTESPAGEEPTDCHFDGPGDAKQGVIASACADQLNAYGQPPTGNRPATVVGGTRKFDAALLRKCLPAE